MTIHKAAMDRFTEIVRLAHVDEGFDPSAAREAAALLTESITDAVQYKDIAARRAMLDYIVHVRSLYAAREAKRNSARDYREGPAF